MAGRRANPTSKKNRQKIYFFIKPPFSILEWPQQPSIPEKAAQRGQESQSGRRCRIEDVTGWETRPKLVRKIGQNRETGKRHETIGSRKKGRGNRHEATRRKAKQKDEVETKGNRYWATGKEISPARDQAL
jgi:hypothetical protein